MNRKERAMEEQEPEVEVDDLEIEAKDAEEVGGGAFQAYLSSQGTKQGANKGVPPGP
jgi:hypothetical protein